MKKPQEETRRYAEYPATYVQKRAASLVNEARSRLQPIIITRHDKPVAFLAPIALLEKLDAALIGILEEERSRIHKVTRVIRESATSQARSSEVKGNAPADGAPTGRRRKPSKSSH